MNTRSLNISQIVAVVILGALVAIGLYTVNVTLGLSTAFGVAGLVYSLSANPAGLCLNAIAGVKPMSLAQIDAEQAKLDARAAELKAQREAVAKEEIDKVAAELDSFPASLSKIMKRPVDMKEAVSLLGQRLRGTFGSLAVRTPGGDSALKGKRLDDATKDKIRAELLAHCAALKEGKTPEPLSAIAARHDIQTQTLDTYKPTAAEVAALPGDKEVPASRMQAAATA